MKKEEIEKIICQIPVVDGHCHPFNPDNEGSFDFRLDFNLYHGGANKKLVENTLFSQKLIEELGKLMGFSPDVEADEIINERYNLYKKSPAEYISKLFNNALFDFLILDTGYPHIEFGVESVDIEDFKRIIPCGAVEIFRIEPLIYKIFEDKKFSFEESIDFFNANIVEAVKTKKVIGLKTVIAYETGLDIGITSWKEVEKAYKRFFSYRNKEDEKIIRDYFVVLSLKKCYEFNIPMQIHTGMGSVPTLDLEKANPLLMMNFLDRKEIRDVKIVLTHAGHPFEQETGMLAGSFKNVYCDVSAISSYFGAGALKTAFLKLFELAPIDKIIFGTDGGIIPETYWSGAVFGKKDLAHALKEMVDSGWIAISKVEKFATMILRENACNLYKIN